MSENLISLNPILRFKLEILKFLNGGTSLPKNEVISDSPTESYRRRNKLFGGYVWERYVAGNWIPIDKEVQTKSGYILKPDGTKVHRSVRLQNQTKSIVLNKPVVREFDPQKSYFVSNLKVQIPLKPRESSTPISNPSNSRVNSPKPRSGWSYGYDRSNEISDIKATLDMLRAGGFYAEGENSKSDGAWGKATEAAYQRYLAAQQTPVLEKPILVPQQVLQITNNALSLNPVDSSYRAYNNYSGQALKNLGFNNYNTMIDYILNNPQNLFSKDMIKQFGDINTWNLTDVEKSLGVSGKYRGSRAGDFGDMARNMSTWAGTFNGTQDRNTKSIPNNSYTNYLINRYSFLKKNGGLLSKNPVIRFKKDGNSSLGKFKIDTKKCTIIKLANKLS